MARRGEGESGQVGGGGGGEVGWLVRIGRCGVGGEVSVTVKINLSSLTTYQRPQRKEQKQRNKLTS